MDELTQNVSAVDLTPVFLGISPKVFEAAYSFYQRSSSVSYVFANRIPAPLRLVFYIKFHRVRSTVGERLMVQALIDFAEQIGNRDTILLLVPCTREYAAMIRKNRAVLESRYVLAEKADRTRPTPMKEGGSR